MKIIKSKLNTVFIKAVIASATLNFEKAYLKHTPLADPEEITGMFEDELMCYDAGDYFADGSCCAVGELTGLDNLNDNDCGEARLANFIQDQVQGAVVSMLVWYGPTTVKVHARTADLLKKMGFTPFAYCSRSNKAKEQIEALYFVIK